MNMLDFVGVIVAIVVVAITYIKWSQTYFRRKGMHYLEPKFPFGNIENPLKRTKNQGYIIKDVYDELKRKGFPYGGFYMITTPILLPVDLNVLRAILSKDFQNFTDRGIFTNEEKNNLNGHLFLLRGNRWRNLRVKLTPTFTSGKMKMMFDTLLECGKPMLQSVEAQTLKKNSLDIKEILGCFTTDVIGSCAFGLECNSFKEEDAEFRRYGKKILETQPAQAIKIVFALNFPKLARKLGLSIGSKDVNIFFNKVVRDTVEYREKNNYQRNDFMQLLINLKNSYGDSGKGLTLDEIAAQTFVFFVAGFETSSTAMTYALYEMSIHPEIQDRARKEVQAVLSQNNGKLTYDGIQEMKYLSQIVDETLRKYPALPILHRECTSDCFIEEANLKVEKGQRFIISVLGLHYDREYFPDPEKFDPERFSEENKRNIKPYSYVPFGEGPRNCIGARFGLMQSKVGLALLLNEFEFSLSPKTQVPITYNNNSLILATRGGMWLDARKLNSSA